MNEAGSKNEAAPALVYRPRRIRVIAWSLSALLVTAMVAVGLLLKRSSTGAVTFTTADQVAMIGLGVIVSAGILMLTRPYVRADERGLEIRNFGGVTRLRWPVVTALRFAGAAPWATVELADGDELSLIAIQAVDRERAADALDALRRLHRAAGDR